MNLDVLNGLDINGAFKIANLVVAGLSVSINIIELKLSVY